jgi:hypothetical protein
MTGAWRLTGSVRIAMCRVIDVPLTSSPTTNIARMIHWETSNQAEEVVA